jgi:hypothetical protein
MLKVALQQAYTNGQDDAASAYGVQPHKKSWGMPLLAGGLAALGTYKFMRTPSFSSHPGLKALQQKAQKGFHRVVDLTTDAAARPPKMDLVDAARRLKGGGGRALLKDVAERAQDSWKPHVNPTTGQLSPLNKFKFWLQEGGEAIPVVSAPGKDTYIPGKPNGVDVKGVTANRHVVPYYGKSSPAKIIRGGTDVEGPLATQRALTELGTKGKGFEADFFNKHAPGSMPESVSDLSKYFKTDPGTAEARVQQIRQIQNQMRGDVQSQNWNEFMLKPTQGAQSQGAFPYGDQDWGALLDKFERHVAHPANAAALQKATSLGPGELAYYLGENKLLEGHTLHHAFKDPASVMAQKFEPGALGEWRVNTMAGAAPESMMMPRYFINKPGNAIKDMAGLGPVKSKQIRDFVESKLTELPPHMREGNFGFDVMPFRGRDGNLTFKILEANPSERAGLFGSEGGGSGLLDTKDVPWAGHAHYRQATGRHTEPVSGLAALGAGAGTAGLVRHWTNDDDQQSVN